MFNKKDPAQSHISNPVVLLLLMLRQQLLTIHTEHSGTEYFET